MKIYIINIIFIFLLIILFFYICNLNINKPSHLKLNENYINLNTNICCFYAYYEKNDLYKTNFEYFLENGILANVDYYIIINGECSVNIPQKDNIIIFRRENKGYDFGAYSYAITKINKEYNYYFFINSSVKGPYLKNNKIPWVEYFLKLFKKNIKIVGTTINIHSNNFLDNYNLEEIYNKKEPFTHVQSMLFCINNEYLKYLNNIDFFNEEEMNNAPNINYIIANKEIGLSQIALKNKWNINCILPYYKDLDYLKIHKDINPTSLFGDSYYKNSYFGKTINEYDVIFFKNNRFI